MNEDEMPNPFPKNELNRILELGTYNLDYSELEDKFQNLTKLAAQIAGTDFSLINIIDSYTQWSVAASGTNTGQTPREESLCQYTILGSSPFEINDLTLDDRFKNNSFVINNQPLKFYWGVPLRTEEGNNLGALCVLDAKPLHLSPEKVEMLQLIADEVIQKLALVREVNRLEKEQVMAAEVGKKVAHDIRGSIGGIIGLSELSKELADRHKDDSLSQVVHHIHISSKAVLELADEILSASTETSHAYKKMAIDKYSLSEFAQKIKNLYGIQANQKRVKLEVNLLAGNQDASFPRGNVLQIAGNLISNAIKFTPPERMVQVNLSLAIAKDQQILCVEVLDQGVGMGKQKIEEIFRGVADSQPGTKGEKGFGYGLQLVRKLVDEAGGTLNIESEEGQSSKFTVKLPV